MDYEQLKERAKVAELDDDKLTAVSGGGCFSYDSYPPTCPYCGSTNLKWHGPS